MAVNTIFPKALGTASGLLLKRLCGRNAKENLVARIYDAEQNTRDTENVQLLKPGHAPVSDSRKFG
jgi:hypothetical protein